MFFHSVVLSPHDIAKQLKSTIQKLDGYFRLVYDIFCVCDDQITPSDTLGNFSKTLRVQELLILLKNIVFCCNKRTQLADPKTASNTFESFVSARPLLSG